MRPRSVCISLEPTCELDARLGGDDVSLAGEKRGGRQRNGHALGQPRQLHWAVGVAAVMVPEARGVTAAAPLQGAVGVHLTTCVGVRREDREGKVLSLKKQKNKKNTISRVQKAELFRQDRFNISHVLKYVSHKAAAERTYLVLEAFCWMR